MTQVARAAELRARGLHPDEIARQVREGEIFRVRRGAYADVLSDRAEDRHRVLVEATASFLGDGAVISHSSAALLHGLPVWDDDIQRVHVTRSRSYGAKKRSWVEVHSATLDPQQVAVIDGMPVTSLSRTVLDLGRTLSMDRSVSAGDHARRLGLTREDLDDALLGLRRWPGVRQARRVVAFLDPRSESVGESISRVRMMRDNLPPPVLQYEVYDGDGLLVGRSDFGWPELKTLGEFDGKVKYGRLLRAGTTPEEAVFKEKVREDAFRDLGHQVVRWIWADLWRPGAIRDRLLRAFARAR